MYSMSQVAEYYLIKDSMTPKKLQKIVYYAYAWFITLMNEDEYSIDNKLFLEEPEAWVHGPVFRSLYDKYKDYGFNEIPKVESKNFNFNKDTLDILEQVWDVYGKFTANELESLTHQESPWILARNGCSKYEICNSTISDSEIFRCYNNR